MKKIIGWIIICFLCLVGFNGCGAKKQLYFYGDYSQTLYECEKNNDEDSLLKHKEELDRIISESQKRSLAVPPGIYAELGFLHFKNNNIDQAVNLFQKEAELYPESQHFMSRLIQMAKKRQDDSVAVSPENYTINKNSNLQN